MPSPAWENLDDFLDPGDFAVKAVITLHGGASRQVSVIYDDPYMNTQLGEYDADATDPRILGKESELRDVLKGDHIQVIGREFYAIRNAEPDGTGMVTVRMAPADASL